MQAVALNLLRLMIGWHILYQGLIKLFNPGWTARPYLTDSGGIFADIFNYLSESPAILTVLDPLNIWLLILIGLALMLGIKIRYAALSGCVLLLLYYLAQPPVAGLTYQVVIPNGGLVVNPLLIEAGALFVLYTAPQDLMWGIEKLMIFSKKGE